MILHIATLVFVVLKALNLIDWSWWLVFAPSILAITIGVTFVGIAAWLKVK